MWMKPVFVLGLIGLVFGAVAIRKKRRKKTTFEKIQGRAEDAINDLEHRVMELRDEAKRLSGEAKQKLQDQAHELESQQRELKKRLNDLSGDAQKLLDRAKSKAAA
jgi:TolA-binding protein